MKRSNTTLVLKLISLLLLVSACTKSRQAELPDDTKPNIYAISEFGEVTDQSAYTATATSMSASGDVVSAKALDQSQTGLLSSDDVTVPDRLKFMFDNLPMSGQARSSFKITFSLDKDYVTSYKVVQNVAELTPLEKSMAISVKDAQLMAKASRGSAADMKLLIQSQSQAETERSLIKSGKKAGALLVPMFKYKIESYGVLEKVKNELREDTATLSLKKSDWKSATHIQIAAQSDNRLLVGMNADQMKDVDQLFVESKVDNQLMTANDLHTRFKVGVSFIDGDKTIFTRLDASVLHVYEVTKVSALNENQLRLLKNNAGNQSVLSCQDPAVAAYIQSKDTTCVILLKADLPISYEVAKLKLVDAVQGSSSDAIEFTEVPRAQSVGLVKILENTGATQKDVSGTLDPNSTVKLSDLQGEFFYRRTFEDAASSFLGRTGTSGDMTIVKFEFEDSRLVVRNQKSLIEYTGQGAKDREELMSFPVKYIKMKKVSSNGSPLTIPVPEETTKEEAEYLILDWTQNTVPDATSPLGFLDAGGCIRNTSSQRVTGTDMRLATDGVLNFSLSGSYTMNPSMECIAVKDVNSAYWGGTYQFNYNVVERISFMKHNNERKTDTQFAMNISPMAQEAFNFGVFTLADKVTENGTLPNRDGSEKYLPIIHDFRNGRKIKYYIGGINTAATTPEKRQILIDATKQVIAEWNSTLRYSFRNTSLERSGDYVEVVVDEGDNTGHLGDLDRSYIWYNELPAENGLLGVAQPAANPRSGVIESANVIIYSGNSFEQAERLLKITALSREYEKMIEAYKKQVTEKAKATKAVASSKDIADAAKTQANIKAGTVNPAAVAAVQAKADKSEMYLQQSIASLQLDNAKIKTAIKNLKMSKSAAGLKHVLSKDLFKASEKGQVVDYPVNDMTFTKKLTELALNKNLAQDAHRFELAVNSAFIKFGSLDTVAQAALQKRSEMLALAIRFDDNNKQRAGCFKYERNDIEDEALNLDPDPHTNLMMNYKKVIMSTLSHELGHAFGLLHNFKASTDKANYEFAGDKETGRNYSSIMDYIADIDMRYVGPGPYDAHALRAAYTGYVELSDDKAVAKKLVNANKAAVATVVGDNLISISDVVKAVGRTSLVHFDKDTLNTAGGLKYFEQCSDGGMSAHIMCAQFDVGSSAEEIVRNKIADYHRGYTSRNYVYDKIVFGWSQKVEAINRNITLFQGIRSYLDEAVMSAIFGAGRTEDLNPAIIADQAKAAMLGYQFFQELIRTPDAEETSLIQFENRFFAVPYQYTTQEADAQGKVTQVQKSDIKILEKRALYDVNLTRDKIDTFGIGYDKLFALQFLMQSSNASSTDDSKLNKISYFDFEQWFMGVQDPADSPTITMLLDILTDNLKAGFYTPSANLTDSQLLQTDIPVKINKELGDQAAISALISLYEAKWKSFDPYAESFKIGRAYAKSAPKDRVNVARAGQSRSKSDTRVYFATQNSVAGDVLVKKAASGEVLIANTPELYTMMKSLYDADQVYRQPISAIVAKACEADDKGQPKDAAACKTAQTKTLDQYMKENPTLVDAKAKADAVAAAIVAKMRVLNAKEVFMPNELDKADSASNFVRQVEILRGMLSSQIGLIGNVLQVLGDTPPAQLNDTIEAVVQTLQNASAKNKKLEVIPLLSLGQSFITDAVAKLKVNLQGGQGVITGAVISKMLMNGTKIKDDNEALLDVLEQVSNYTGMIDPDTVSMK